MKVVGQGTKFSPYMKRVIQTGKVGNRPGAVNSRDSLLEAITDTLKNERKTFEEVADRLATS